MTTARSMRPVRRRAATAAALTLAFTAAAPLRAQGDGVRLSLGDGARLDGRAYVMEMTQTAAIEAQGERREIGRQARARVRLAAAPAAGTSQRVTMTLDSLRASITTPHSREVVDTRRHRGRSFAVGYPRAGGSAAFDSTTPALDYSSVGGVLPLGAVLGHLFPPMPDRVVRVGESWERAWTRTSIDGNTLGDRPVTSRLTLRAIDGRGDARVARVEIATRGAPANGAGAVEAKGFALVEVATGAVREVSIEETVTGTYNFGAGFPYRQTTTIRIAAPDAGGGR